MTVRSTRDSSVSAIPHRRSLLTEPLQPTAMREVNMGALLRAVRSLGPLARVELAEKTGISPATVTKLVASLTEAHILQELPDVRTERSTGRPRVPIDFPRGSRVVSSLHIGAQSCVVAAVDLRGRELARREVAHVGSTPEQVLTNAAVALRDLGAGLETDARQVGIGVSSGGTVDYQRGLLLSHPLLTWRNVDVRQILNNVVDLPVEYDETVRGVALYEQQNARWPAETILHVFVGRAVQSALVIDGRLHRGYDSRAGTLDHWPVTGVHGPVCACGQTNCFGRVASNDGVAWLARDRGLIPAGAGYNDLLLAAEAGNQNVRHLLLQRARWVGRMVAAASDLIDPSLVLISGTAQRSPGFTEELAAELDQAGGPVGPSRLRYSATPFDVVAAASALFLDVYFDDPVHFEPGLQRRFAS